MAINPVEIIIKAKDEASGVFASMGSKVAAVGASIAAYFGISAFAGAIKGAAELEAKLSEVAAVSGATTKEMVDLRTAAEAAGSTTKFTATEGADALGNLTRAGLSAKDAIAALPAVLTLAQAGGVGLAEASEYVTKAVMGMGLAFTDSGRVADVLAAGANASNTSVTGLAQALSYAAPVANSLGLSLETTVAIIGKFADAGIDASRAGTALNAVLSQFADPASKFRQELGSAGIITGNFEKALHQLAAAGPAGEKAILAVGTEAGPALRALLNQGIGALDDLKSKLDNAKGSAAATAAVMEDNLNGAFNSLASAWDTVRNALATPVLPVLRDGVVQLSQALSSAVSDGTIGKFGDAIATAFQSGLKWAREFLGTVDFAALSARMQAFADSMKETFTKIGEYATNAGNIVQTAYGVMSAGANAVLTAIYGIGIVFSEAAIGVVRASLSITEALQKIAIGSAKQRLLDEAEIMRTALVGLTGVSEEFGKKARGSFVAMGDGAKLARDAVVGLMTDAANAAPAIEALSDAEIAAGNESKIAEFRINEMASSIENAGKKAQAAGILHKEGADKARAAVAELKTEYEAALAAGNVQLAVEKLQAMQGALKSTGDQAKLTGQDIENAFTRMGVTSSAELARVRDAALRDYQIIKEAATSTARDKAEAFRVYAEKAIAANNGVVTEVLKVKAAMEGVSIQVDGTGKAIVKSMAEGAAAVKTVEDAYRQLGLKTPAELDKIAVANAAAWNKISGDSKASLETLKAAFTTYANSAIAAAGDVGSSQRQVSEETLKAEAAVKGLAVSFDASGKIIVQTQAEAAAAIDRTTGSLGGQKDAVDAVTSALERQNAAQERANAAVEKEAELDRKRRNVDKNGFLIMPEATMGAPVDTKQTIYKNLIENGLTETQSLKLSDEFEKLRNPNYKYGQWTQQLTDEMNAFLRANAQGRSDKEIESGTSGVVQSRTNRPAAPATPTQAVAKSYTVNVNIAGKSTPINTSSDADAQALIALLQSAKLSSGL